VPPSLSLDSTTSTLPSTALAVTGTKLAILCCCTYAMLEPITTKTLGISVNIATKIFIRAALRSHQERTIYLNLCPKRKSTASVPSLRRSLHPHSPPPLAGEG